MTQKNKCSILICNSSRPHRNAAFAGFFVIILVKMLDVPTSTPALLTQIITKNPIKIDILPVQSERL